MDNNTDVSLVDITEDNYLAVCRLTVFEWQKAYVAPCPIKAKDTASKN